MSEGFKKYMKQESPGLVAGAFALFFMNFYLSHCHAY